MPLKLESSYLNGFVSQHEYEAIAPQVETAHQLLMSKTGMGNDFLGWVNLPTAYDKEEFARIKPRPRKSRATPMCSWSSASGAPTWALGPPSSF